MHHLKEVDLAEPSTLFSISLGESGGAAAVAVVPWAAAGAYEVSLVRAGNWCRAASEV